MIRVLLVDDHELVRMGLRSYLETEPDVSVVGEAVDGEEAVQKAQELRPDVILMDLLMPRKSGIEATIELKKLGNKAQIVILTSSLDDEKVVQALKAGALSYILKTTVAKNVTSAIRAASHGESVLDAQVQGKLIGELRNQGASKPWDELTDRERDVLRAIAEGRNNQEIADYLGIGLKTVKTHVSSIFLKLGVMDRTQAAIYAIRNGLD